MLPCLLKGRKPTNLRSWTTPDQLPSTEVTCSVIELPKHDPLEASEDAAETMEDYQLLTPAYQ